MERKIDVHLYLPESIFNLIQNTIEGKNASERIYNLITNNLFIKQAVEQRIISLQDELNRLNIILKEEVFFNQQPLSCDEIKYIKDSVPMIRDNIILLQARHRGFNSMFFRNIGLGDFKRLLLEYKG
jgi:hypothetical protein